MKRGLPWLMVAGMGSPLLLAGLGAPVEPVRDPCELGIEIQQEAEYLNGGAHYAMGDGPYCTTPSLLAHDDHMARYGGTFYMAPNGIHHVEFRYSDRCGAQVILYNAYTQEVNAAEQLVGMVKVTSDDDTQPLRERFLAPSSRGIVLGADIGPIQRPFEMEFRLQFPYRPQPDWFPVYISE